MTTTSTPVQIQTRRMRQSTINKAETCLHRLSFTDQPYRTGVNRAMGTATHSGHEFYYQARMDNPDLPIDIAVKDKTFLKAIQDAAWQSFVEEQGKVPADEFDWVFQPKTSRYDEIVYTPEMARLAMDELFERYHEHGWYWPAQYEIWAVEKSFDLPWKDGWTQSGTVDLVVFDTDSGWIHVVDHKTSKKKWNRNKHLAYQSPQAQWYIHAARRLYNTEEVTFTYDIATWTGEFERRSAHRTEAQLEATQKHARLVADIIDRGGPFPPNPSSFLCSSNYCDYWEVCEFGEALHG